MTNGGAPRFGPTVQRLAALGILILFGGTLWMGYDAFFWQSITRSRAQIAVYKDSFAQLAPQRPDLEGLRRRAASGPSPYSRHFFAHAAGQVPGAALQARIRDLTAEVGATVTRLNILPSTERLGTRRIQMEFSISLPDDSVIPLLKNLERALPLVFVERLALRARDRATPDTAKAGVRMIDGDVAIYAFERP